MMINQLFPPYYSQRGAYFISTAFQKMDAHVVHDYLCNQSYWAKGIAMAQVVRSMQYSFCFGVFVAENGRESQIGFARVMSDFTTFAYLADLFILEAYRGQGLGKWLVECILSHPELQNLRGWTLRTKDAHTLYTRFGFEPVANPENSLVLRPVQQPDLTISPEIQR